MWSCRSCRKRKAWSNSWAIPDYVHLFYVVPTTGPEKVLEFYRKELPALGWTMRAGTDKIEDGKAKVILEAPEKDSLRLELLADKQGTAVLIAAVPPG